MKKVLIVGSPGSGKSTFARRLQEATSLPLYHLDLLYWNDDRTTVSEEEFLQRLNAILDRSRWIIDGNYEKTLAYRLQYCDTVFFLDYSPDVCLAGISDRIGKPRPDLPWTEAKADPELIDLVRHYPERDRKSVMNHLARHASGINTIIFSSREDADQFFMRIKNA